MPSARAAVSQSWRWYSSARRMPAGWRRRSSARMFVTARTLAGIQRAARLTTRPTRAGPRSTPSTTTGVRMAWTAADPRVGGAGRGPSPAVGLAGAPDRGRGQEPGALGRAEPVPPHVVVDAGLEVDLDRFEGRAAERVDDRAEVRVDVAWPVRGLDALAGVLEHDQQAAGFRGEGLEALGHRAAAGREAGRGRGRRCVARTGDEPPKPAETTSRRAGQVNGRGRRRGRSRRPAPEPHAPKCRLRRSPGPRSRARRARRSAGRPRSPRRRCPARTRSGRARRSATRSSTIAVHRMRCWNQTHTESRR